MKYLTLKVEAAKRIRAITPINNIHPIISNPLYADDVMILVTADIESASTLKRIIDYLSNMAGLTLNQLKTKVYFSASCTNKENILSFPQL